MEEHGARIIIEVTEKTQGRYDYFISGSHQLSLSETRGILVGALHLCVMGENTPSEQGKALREVIEFLESEFISTDESDVSFSSNDDVQ
jgi:uncharacterized protein YggU (UPF0235/DUF167 family)